MRMAAALFAILASHPSPVTGQPSGPVWGYLDNGMAYALLESHAAPLIGSTVVVHAGSSREDFATSGASHFLEHLLFNGTATRTQEQLYAEVDGIGGYNNATTRKTHVVYMMVTPAEQIRKGLEIQADMLFNSTLPPEKVEKERGIILEEFAKDADSGGLSLERSLDLGFFGPNGDGLPTLGSPQSIRGISRDKILEFYRAYYTPQNMSLVVVGDFVSSEMEAHIKEVFGSIPAGTSAPRLEPVEPAWGGPPTVLPHTGGELAIEWTFLGPDPRSSDYVPFAALTDLLAGGESSRLNQHLKSAFPSQVMDVGGRIDLVPGRSYLRIRALMDPAADWHPVVEKMPSVLQEIRLLPADGDVASWKVAEESGEFYLRERPHYYGIMRGDDLAVRGIESIIDAPARLAALSQADLAAVLPRWASGPSRVVVGSPRGAASAAAESLAARTRVVSTFRLENGLDILVLSSPESPVLALHLFVRGRSQAEPHGMEGAAELLHRLMSVRTASSSPEILARRLRSIGAELKTADDPNIPYDDFYSTGASTFVRLQSLDQHFDEALRLLAEMLQTPPAWTDEEFASAQRQMIVSAEKAAMNSSASARQITREALYGEGWRARPVFGTPGSIKALDAAMLRRFASEYWVANRMLLVVATSLSPAVVEASARTVLGRLPAGSAAPDLNDRRGILESVANRYSTRETLPAALEGIGIPDSALLRTRSVGGRQAAVNWVRFLGTCSPADFPAVEVWNAVVSNQIQLQLREREGLAYSIGSSVDRLDDGRVLWVATAASGKENLGRILQGFGEAFDRAARLAPPDDEVRRQAYQSYGRSLMRRATRMNQAYAAGLAVMEGRNPAAIDEEVRAVSRVEGTHVGKVLPILSPRGLSLVAIAY